MSVLITKISDVWLLVWRICGFATAECVEEFANFRTLKSLSLYSTFFLYCPFPGPGVAFAEIFISSTHPLVWIFMVCMSQKCPLTCCLFHLENILLTVLDILVQIVDVCLQAFYLILQVCHQTAVSFFCVIKRTILVEAILFTIISKVNCLGTSKCLAEATNLPYALLK